MQLKTLVILGVISIISVGMAFILVSKGYVRIGKPEGQAPAVTALEGVTAAEAKTSDQKKTSSPEKAADDHKEEVKSEKAADKQKTEESKKGEPKKEGDKGEGGAVDVEANLVRMEPIIVNLKGSYGRRYLKVGINFGIEGVSKEAVEGKKVEIRDVLISLLSAKSIEDVDGWSDQDTMRSEIKEVLNKKLGLDDGIHQVFFTDFVVQ